MKRCLGVVTGFLVAIAGIAAPCIAQTAGVSALLRETSVATELEPIRTGIVDMRSFLERCPTNDPAYEEIRHDFELRSDGALLTSPIVCTEPISSLPLEQYTDELIALQILRTAYYMGRGTEGSLPWTSKNLYAWMTSNIAGVNIKTVPGQLYCCDLIDGKKYFSTSRQDDFNRDFKRTWPGIAIGLDFFAHEIRHADALVPGHTTGCPAFPHATDPAGCDATYDLSNLSSFGIQYWLQSKWATGFMNVGIACSPPATAMDYAVWDAQCANGFRGRFVKNPPPVVTATQPYGGLCFALSKGLEVPTGGAVTALTEGAAESIHTGYSATAFPSGTPSYGVAIFSFAQNGAVVSEAGVPASPPTTAARILIDYRAHVSALPARPEEGSVDVNTGLALVNQATPAANVTYTLRDRDGKILATGHGVLKGKGHFAKFINELKDVAPDFTIPEGFSTSTQFGSLTVEADRPVSVLALRLTVNQRNETLLTSTLVADLNQAPVGAPKYIPQFVDGGGSTTTLFLLNTSNTVERGRFTLFDDDGAALVVNSVGGTKDSGFNYAISPGGLFVFQTDGSPAAASAGWVQLIPDAGHASPVAAGVFGLSQAGLLVTESGLPSTASTTRARVYIDQSGKHGTGLALGNPGRTGISVALQAYEMDGTTPAGGVLPIPIPLAAGGHRAGFASELVPGLPSGFRGVLEVRSASPFAALTLRSLTNSRNNFLVTTFPVADATRDAPSPIVFPQIADGGGYFTEFIFLSAGGKAAFTLDVYGEDGNLLALRK